MEALVNLGDVYLVSGRHGEAIKSFSTAIELHPECSQARDLLGVATFRAGDRESARAQFELLRQSDPTFDGKLSTLLKAESIDGQ